MTKKKRKESGKPDMPSSSSEGHRGEAFFSGPLVHLFLILLSGLVVYMGTLKVPFLFDDHSSIVDNPIIKDLGNFTGPEAWRYNPRRFLGYLSFAVNYHFGGLNVTGYHLVNAAIHLCTSVVYYFLVRLTFDTPRLAGPAWKGRAPAVALAGALLFVVHPVQTQAVTYIVQRFASLATLFYLLAMLCYAAGRLRQERCGRTGDAAGFLLLGVGAFSGVLAMMTKEIAFTLPCSVILYETIFFHNSRRKTIAATAGLATCAVGFLLLAFSSDRSVGSLLADVSASLTEARHISRTDYLLTQFRVIVTYIRLLFVPVRQNLDYDYPLYQSLFEAPVLGSLLFLLLLLGGGFILLLKAGKDRNPLLRLTAFGIFWFFTALSIESSLIPISDLIFEHRLYLPSAGAFMAITSGGALFWRKLPLSASITIFTTIVLLLGLLTWQRNALWQDEVTLWQDTVAKSPGKARSHNELGKVLFDRKKYQESITEFGKAISLAPQFLPPHNNLGAAYMKTGEVDAAIEEYRKALLLAPQQPETHNNLGTAYDRKGMLDEALAEFRQAISHKPDYAAAHNNMGAALRKKGRFAEAKAEYETALRLKPEYASPYNNLGILSAVQGRLDEAKDMFEAAIRLQPDNPEFRENLAKVYEMKGLHDRAASERENVRAIRQDPSAPPQ